MYTDYYLKFTDEAAANSALYTEESVLQEDVVETIKVPKYSAIDVIGTIYEPTGQMLTVEGQESPEMKAVPGFHVNVRHESEAPELEEFAVNPVTPIRSWF
jgi:hypothetical protein